jgi:hypothetical protein
MLEYDPARHGYVVALGREALENAPAYDAEELSRLGGPHHHVDRGLLVEYYGRYGLAPPFY